MQFWASRWLHLVFFILSFIILWVFSENDFVSMYLFELCALYIAVVHQSRRELLPALAILICFKLATLPVWQLLFSDKTVSFYLIAIIVYNVVLASILVRSYRSDALRSLFRVQTISRKIPQVLAMSTVLGLGAIHSGLVLIEVQVYDYDPTFFNHVPFFYRTYESFSLAIKGLLLLAIWSMCLDSYFVDYERYRRLTGVVKTN